MQIIEQRATTMHFEAKGQDKYAVSMALWRKEKCQYTL
jgi:hypothetical protein